MVLVIKITTQSIIIGYGIFKHKIDWDNVLEIYRDKSSTVNYGGWGVHFGKVEGNWRLVYNIPETPRLVLRLKKGIFREFVFSTKKPDDVIRLVDEQINL